MNRPVRPRSRISRRFRAFIGWQAALVLVGFSFATFATDAAAQTTKRPQIIGIEAGFGGTYKIGCWTPIAVTLAGGTEATVGFLEVIAPDGDGVPVHYYSDASRPIQVFARNTETAIVFARFGRSDATIRVRYHPRSQRTVERTFTDFDSEAKIDPIAATDFLVVSIGSQVAHPKDFGYRDQQEPRLITKVIADVGKLPTRWYGYEGVDALVIPTGRPELLRSLLPGSARHAALKQWVELGGHVVLSAGVNAPEILDDQSPFAWMVPGRFEKMVPLRSSDPIIEFADSEGTALDIDTKVPKLTDVVGRIEAYAGNDPADLPLVIRSPLGLGEVMFIAVDLDLPPIGTWRRRGDVVAQLLPHVTRDDDLKIEGHYYHFGSMHYTDIISRLRSSLDDFKGVRPVPFGIVAMLIALYIALIGPVDYLFVKNVLKRMEATWITFPLTVLVVSVTAYYGANWLKGRDLRVNKVELVDIDVASGQVRGTYWCNIFSPRPDSYDLTLDPKLLGNLQPTSEPEVVMSWLGVPGEGIGGMGSGGGPSSFSSYTIPAEVNQIEGLPIQVWSTKALSIRWSCKTDPLFTADLKETTTGFDRGLEGTVENDTGIELSDAALLYGNLLWNLGDIPSGEQLAMVDIGSPSNIHEIFGTEPTYEFDTGASHETDDIVEAMLFHRRTREFNGEYPESRYQAFTDLTHLLDSGRAVLVARVDGTVSALLRNGEPLRSVDDRTWRYVRFVIPVDNEEK